MPRPPTYRVAKWFVLGALVLTVVLGTWYIFATRSHSPYHALIAEHEAASVRPPIERRSASPRAPSDVELVALPTPPLAVPPPVLLVGQTASVREVGQEPTRAAELIVEQAGAPVYASIRNAPENFSRSHWVLDDDDFPSLFPAREDAGDWLRAVAAGIDKPGAARYRALRLAVLEALRIGDHEGAMDALSTLLVEATVDPDFFVGGRHESRIVGYMGQRFDPVDLSTLALTAAMLPVELPPDFFARMEDALAQNPPPEDLSRWLRIHRVQQRVQSIARGMAGKEASTQRTMEEYPPLIATLHGATRAFMAPLIRRRVEIAAAQWIDGDLQGFTDNNMVLYSYGVLFFYTYAEEREGMLEKAINLDREWKAEDLQAQHRLAAFAVIAAREYRATGHWPTTGKLGEPYAARDDEAFVLMEIPVDRALLMGLRSWRLPYLHRNERPESLEAELELLAERRGVDLAAIRRQWDELPPPMILMRLVPHTTESSPPRQLMLAQWILVAPWVANPAVMDWLSIR